MVVGQLLRIGIEILGNREYANPHLETRLILAKLLKVDKSYIYAHEDLEISKEIEDEFTSIMKKMASGHPIQYILKEKEFMGLDFYVDEGVLIPRADTEILVEFIIDYIDLNYKDENINILDLGTGSGAIALSTAYYCKETSVYATDLSPKAIEVANINMERFSLENVKIEKGDLFQPIEQMKNSFEIIASNPPYIQRDEIDGLQNQVKDYEPLEALDGGEDGLKFYKDISKRAKEFLKNKGLLIYEIGYNQGKEVSNILYKEGYKDIEILKDLHGKNRVVLGKRGE